MNYYSVNYDSKDGLYLTVPEENKDSFIKSLKPLPPIKTDLKGFFNRKLEIVGKLNGMTIFYKRVLKFTEAEKTAKHTSGLKVRDIYTLRLDLSRTMRQTGVIRKLA